MCQSHANIWSLYKREQVFGVVYIETSDYITTKTMLLEHTGEYNASPEVVFAQHSHFQCIYKYIVALSNECMDINDKNSYLSFTDISRQSFLLNSFKTKN